jgi:hypothetical protein
VPRVSAFAPLYALLPPSATTRTTNVAQTLRLSRRFQDRRASVGVTAHLSQRRYHTQSRSSIAVSLRSGGVIRRLEPREPNRSTICVSSKRSDACVRRTSFTRARSLPLLAYHQAPCPPSSRSLTFYITPLRYSPAIACCNLPTSFT